MSLRTFTSCFLLLGCLVVCAFPASAQDSAEWNLVFEDDFEREDLGNDYVVNIRNTEKSGAIIVDGQLLMKGEGCIVVIDRPFAMDVRVEFDARSWEELPPCDLSVTLNSPPQGALTYFLSFGGHINKLNRLGGPGVHYRDQDPEKRIEPGRTHKMLAEREGRRIRYIADGVTLMEDSSDTLVGGPGLDRVGFVTWTGMYVDNVRVYERAEPHPETRSYITSLPGLPLERDVTRVYAREGEEGRELDEALEALNNGEFDRAKELFNGMDDVLLRLSGLAFVLGDINYHEKPVYGNHGTTVDFGEFGEFAETWKREAEAHPEITELQEYRTAVESFGKLVFNRGSGFEAKMLMEIGPENNPFYYKAKLFQARYLYYGGAEAGSREMIGQAMDMMRELHSIWPENVILREYVGKPVPWGEEYTADTENHPEWAAYLREAYARQVAILTEFCRTRQMPDGQLGGGWGDDVEMLRSWVQVAAISSAAEGLRSSIDKLSEGIWTHVAVEGYDPFPNDVEHTAEPTADTFPTQLLLRHGDPLYHQWNLASCRTLRNVTMGIDDNGYPRFKAVVMGQEGVRDGLLAGGDTGYHARAMKHFYWLGWYGNEEARQLYVDWADGWRHTVMLDRADKPEGIAPGTIWYPSGDYNPPNGVPWYSDDAFNYYGTLGLSDMVHEALLAAYSFSGERKFLRPYQRMMDYATAGPLVQPGAEPGSEEWFRGSQYPNDHARIASAYRMLTGQGVYDEYIRRSGSAPQQYQLDHDRTDYLKRAESAAKSLRHNLKRLTTETMATDRYWIPATDEVWGAYSGAIQGMRDARMPFMGVTYNTPTTDFAAIVVENHPERVRLWFYSFWEEPTEIGLQLWRLVPGEYLLTHGEILPGERDFQQRYAWSEPERVEVLRKGDVVNVTVPPMTEYCIDLRLDREMAVPEKAADLAVHARDIVRSEEGVTATFYNLGNTAAHDIEVRLERRSGDGWTTVATETVRRLSEPVDFSLFEEKVTLPASRGDLRGELRVVVDAEDRIFELCETNNIAAF